ncbi:uncharacterized protein BJ212DRAFT_1281516, partial [Suillus subaureus]
FSTNITIENQIYHVLMENIPIAFCPDSTAALTDPKKKASIAPKSILKARYIKPIVRRNPNEGTAHVMKLLPKPSRCLKCHSYDGSHMATWAMLLGVASAQHSKTNEKLT